MAPAESHDTADAVAPSGLLAAAEPLCRRYDVALLDLDGVVYVGDQAVPAAPTALRSARAAGMRLAFVTNNAARSAADVAGRLTNFGVPASAVEVITSAQVAAHYLARRLPRGAAVLVVGTTGLVEALRERGLRPVDSAEDSPAAVVQGYSPTLNYQQLAEGALAIRRGVPWLATNLDATVPSARGPLPGNGSMVAALRLATGAHPASTGKPDPTMHRETVERTGARAPLVVGDRLDTDIEGARAVGCPSLLVLSGVTDAATLLAAPAEHRPAYIGWDVSALMRAHPAPREAAGEVTCGSWRVEVADAILSRLADHPAGDISADPPAERDGLDGLRAMASFAWAHPAEHSRLHPGDDAAGRLFAELGLPHP